MQRDLRTALRQKTRPSSPAGAEAPAAVKPAARPVDEVELAITLGLRRDPELAGLVRRWLPYSLITDPVCRAVIHVLAEEEEDLMAALDDEGEECQAFAAQIVTSPQKLVGTEDDMTAAKAVQDLVMRIWRRYLAARKTDLEVRKQHLEGAERQPVLQEFFQVVMDLEKLKRGWEPACPIMDLYLQRFAEG